MSEDERRYSKAELTGRIQAAYLALEEAIRPLDEARLALPGPDGWSIKDHLAHLATWEVGMLELLQRRERFAAMGIEEAEREGRPIDEVNDIIFRRNMAFTASEAVDRFRQVHQRFMAVLDTLSDDDLYRPYADYLPDGEDGPREPVMNWIAGNTFGHFEEHLEYIRRLVA